MSLRRLSLLAVLAAAGRAAQFEKTKAKLKRRFEAALDERMERLQQQPAPRLGR